MSATRGDRRGREIGRLFKCEVTPAGRLCDDDDDDDGDGSTPMKIERGALSDTVKRAKRESAAREILRQGRHLDLNPKPGCIVDCAAR